MSNEFLKSNPKIDELVNSATSFESIRESVKTQLADDGVILRSRGDQYGATLLRQQETVAPVSSADPVTRENATHIRFVYPKGNLRIEITGCSEKELDEAEAQLRSTLR